MHLWHFILGLLVLAVVGVFAVLRNGSNRDDAWDELTAMRRRQWEQERTDFNFRGGRR